MDLKIKQAWEGSGKTLILLGVLVLVVAGLKAGEAFFFAGPLGIFCGDGEFAHHAWTDQARGPAELGGGGNGDV